MIFQIADDGVLDQFVVRKCRFVQALALTIDAFDSLPDMAEVYEVASWKQQLIPALLANTGFAETLRQYIRRQRINGESSSCRSSSRIAPMSKSVVSGAGSTRISRSLYQVSKPFATEPNTRAFDARWAATMRGWRRDARRRRC